MPDITLLILDEHEAVRRMVADGLQTIGGFRVLADTAVRVWHVGNYAYTWEDAGTDRKRFATFHYNFDSKEADSEA